MIRAWLLGLLDRVSLWPEPADWGQPHLSVHGFMYDATLRPQSVPPEIEDVGGFSVGVEMAFTLDDDQVQPMGPVVVFMVVPMDPERSEVRISFPLGIARESERELEAEWRRAWPGAELRGDAPPGWAFWDFDRRLLFEAIATGGPLPPGAPPRCQRTPLPWRRPSPVTVPLPRSRDREAIVSRRKRTSEEDDFRERYQKVYWSEARRLGHRPNSDEMAAAFVIGDRSVDRYVRKLREDGLPYPPPESPDDGHSGEAR